MSAADPGDPAALPGGAAGAGDAAGAGAPPAQRAASSQPAFSRSASAQPPPGPAPDPASPTSDAASATATATASVNADNPWLGLASFTEETRAFFFGREQEITELERRVQRKLLTVLFGKSGLGKTSILQAGLVPGLRARGYFPVYLRIDYGHDSPEPAEQIKQAINRAAAVRAGERGERGERGESAGAAGEEAAARGTTAEGIAAEEAALQAVSGQGGAAPAIDPGESIWEFLHHREVLQDSGTVPGDISAETRTVKSVATPPAVAAPLQPPSPSPAAPHRPSAPLTPIPLLIFDQFEELFTLAQSDEFGRARAARFVEELADLVENRPPKALEAKLDSDDSIAERFDFARSDYRVVISLREDYLAPLESLKKQMPSLSQNRLRLAPMTGAQALEAVLLPGQRLAPGRRLDAQTAQLPGGPPGAGKPLVSQEVAEAIVRFVAGGSELANAEVEPSLLSLICRELNEQRLAQHHSEISLGLLAGSRESILSSFYERALADQPPAVRSLIEDELLTESGYRENLAEESLLRKLQTAGAAPDALARLVNRRLLRIEERLDVRRVELTHDVLTGVVKASRDQRHEREARAATERLLAEQAARENAARRALRRARAIAAGCTALAVVAVVAAVVAFFSVQRARSAEQLARQTRAISEQARQEAEGLLGFLTDDFVGELETFGRDQTIAELSQREIDYFQHLPAQLKDPQTVRSGALALLNHAEALTYLGDHVTARKNASEAVALLEQLQRDGDRSDPTTVTLGRAYAQRAALSRGPFQSAQAVVDVRKAADLLRPLAGRAGASDSARRAYLEVLMAELSVERETDEAVEHETDEEEMRVAQEAQRVGRDLGAPDHGDVTADTHYANAEALLASDLIDLGRNDEGRRAAEEALAQLGQILALRPQYGAALGDQEGVELTLMDLARNELDPAEALRFATQAEQTALVQVRVEPQNLGYTLNLHQAYVFVAASMWDVGRLREAVDYSRKAMETVGHISAPGPNSALQIALTTASTADFQAQLGDFSGAAATVAAGKALMNRSTLRKLGTAGRATEAFLKVISAATAADLAYERGNFAAARQIARSAMAAPSGQAALDQGMRSVLGELEARADYALRDFTAAVQAERTVLGTDKTIEGSDVHSQRASAPDNMWLAMALARDGKRAEAARTIAPVVAMYRALDKKNHGDPWLPLEFAGALYAQSLTDDAHRAALLREAAQRIDHLVPTIAALHDTREWRTRIEKAQRIASGETARRTERGEAGR